MDILSTLAGWAKTAWNTISGVGAAYGEAFTDFWQYVTSEHNLVAWLMFSPVVQLVKALLDHGQASGQAQTGIQQALARIPGWIWVHEVRPVRDKLLALIRALRAWAWAWFQIVFATIQSDFAFALAWTNMQVGIERRQRIQAVDTEHKLMLARVQWALNLVQQEAASGYNTGTAARKSVIQSLLADLTERDPAVAGLVNDLASLIVDVETIDNPIVRFAVGKVLAEVISHLGIDQAITDLIGRLLGPLTGNPRPATLYDVTRDVAARLSALEAQWAAFMTDGGPEIIQAGKGWKDLTGVLVDAAVLSYVGLAVTDPSAWSTATNDTIGAAAAAAMTGIVDLIHGL